MESSEKQSYKSVNNKISKKTIPEIDLDLKLLNLPLEILNYIYQYVCLEFFEKLEKLQDIFDFYKYFNKKYNIEAQGFSKEYLNNLSKFKLTCKAFNNISLWLNQNIEIKFNRLKKMPKTMIIILL